MQERKRMNAWPQCYFAFITRVDAPHLLLKIIVTTECSGARCHNSCISSTARWSWQPQDGKTLQWHSNHEEITAISAVWDSNIVETQLPGQAENANLMREKYEILRIQQIHLIYSYRTEVANGWCKWQSGGDRRMAVTSHFVSETECGQGQLLAEIPTYPLLILSSWCVTKKKALDWVEVKFPCFLGIVHLTIYQK